MRWRAVIGITLAALIAGCSDANDSATPNIEDRAVEMLALNPAKVAAMMQSSDFLTCVPTVLDICGNDSCSPTSIGSKPPVKIKLRLKTGDYHRCGADGGCDVYSAVVSESGAYAIAALPENRSMLWLTSDGSYREIANLHTDTFVYRGKCKKE